MSKRANPMAVKAALTYEISELAKVLGVTPATIRNWIKDGLPVMSSRKPHLISGAEIRDYLRAKYHATKTPLRADELFCFVCRAGRNPVDMSVTIVPNTPKTSRLKGACECCGASACRVISNTRTREFAEIFKINPSGPSEV